MSNNSESYITVSTEYVVRLANAKLAKCIDKAEKDFVDYITEEVVRLNKDIIQHNERALKLAKSPFKFLYSAKKLKIIEETTVEIQRDNVITEFRKDIQQHDSYRYDWDNHGIIGAVAEDPKETWPTLWALANINVAGIKHNFRMDDVTPNMTMQLSIKHAKLIGLIF
jgi:hypothetical protein